MSLSTHAISAPAFERALTNMLAWFDKAEAHATTRGFDPDLYLQARFAPDMFPLTRQVQVATDAVKGCVSRLAGVEAPSWPDEEKTLDELRARIRKAIDYAMSVPAAKIDAGAERDISLPLPSGAIHFTGETFITSFALPNFYFHAAMVYALLRHSGVQLGKMDYLGAP